MQAVGTDSTPESVFEATRRFLANPNARTRGPRNTGAIDDAGPSERFLVRCAWCNRIKVGDRFVPLDPAVVGADDLAERTTHGICPECFER